MAVLPIRVFGDPVLRERARGVDKITAVHRRLVNDMFETMRAAPGVGLAAPQVGILERIFVWEVDDVAGAVINPRITRRSTETAIEDEGCLSLPGLVYGVERPFEVRLEGLDEHGRPVSLDADELTARVFQHELDHLDGVLFVDRLAEGARRDALRQLNALVLGLPADPAARAEPGEAL